MTKHDTIYCADDDCSQGCRCACHGAVNEADFCYVALELERYGYLQRLDGCTHHLESTINAAYDPQPTLADARAKCVNEDYIIGFAENGQICELLFTKEQFASGLDTRLRKYKACYGGYTVREAS